MAKNLKDLSQIVSDNHNIGPDEAYAFVSDIFEMVVTALQTEKSVKIKGLGAFKIVDVQDRESVNVNTGERVIIEGHGKVSFTPETSLKELVNRPFSQFETVFIDDDVDITKIDPEEDESDVLSKIDENIFSDENLEEAREVDHFREEQTKAEERRRRAEKKRQYYDDEPDDVTQMPDGFIDDRTVTVRRTRRPARIVAKPYVPDSEPVVEVTKPKVVRPKRAEAKQEVKDETDDKELISMLAGFEEENDPTNAPEQNDEMDELVNLIKNESEDEEDSQDVDDYETAHEPEEEEYDEPEEEPEDESDEAGFVEFVDEEEEEPEPQPEPVSHIKGSVERKYVSISDERRKPSQKRQVETVEEEEEDGTATRRTAAMDNSRSRTSERKIYDIGDDDDSFFRSKKLMYGIGAALVALALFSIGFFIGMKKQSSKIKQLEYKIAALEEVKAFESQEEGAEFSDEPRPVAQKANVEPDQPSPKPQKPVKADVAEKEPGAAPAPAPQPKKPAAGQKDNAPAKPAVAKEEKPAPANGEELDYRVYERKSNEIRTGAYRIIGVQNTIKAREGETLNKISARILGPGMTCYLSALNDLPKDAVLSEGQVIKIPKLKLKIKKNKPNKV